MYAYTHSADKAELVWTHSWILKLEYKIGTHHTFMQSHYREREREMERRGHASQQLGIILIQSWIISVPCSLLFPSHPLLMEVVYMIYFHSHKVQPNKGYPDNCILPFTTIELCTGQLDYNIPHT